MRIQLTIAALVASALVIGCSQNKRDLDDADVGFGDGGGKPVAPAVQYTPPPAPQPVITQAPREQAVSADSVADASDTISPTPSPARHVTPQRQVSSKTQVASAKGAKYTIKKGDSLWSIAKSHYGDGNKWKLIASANPKLDPNKVQAGQTITIP